MRASEVRELLKLIEQEDIIPFGGGMPDPTLFPKDELARIVEEVVRDERALQYSPTEGIRPLRETVAKLLRSKGIEVTYEDVLITTGSQQALDLISKVYLDPGDVVVSESPTYLSAIGAFRSYEADIAGIEMDKGGMDMDGLRSYLDKEWKRCKFIYTIPTYQNPSGITMSYERRRELLEIAREYGKPIVEDDPYGELTYEGEVMKPIRSLPNSDFVTYLGTASKILAPGLRVAWMVGPKDLLRKCSLAKQATDLCTPALTQTITKEFIDRGYLAGHLEKLRSIYRVKRDAILEAMKNYFPPGVTWTHPNGGMFIWVTLPHGMDTSKMLPKALEKKIAYVSGGAFHPDGSGENTMRINFSFPTLEEIDEGIKRLGELIEEVGG
jgi:2-aminoadipate transaminase